MGWQDAPWFQSSNLTVEHLDLGRLMTAALSRGGGKNSLEMWKS